MSGAWIALAGLVFALAATWALGRWRWSRKTRNLIAALEAGRVPAPDAGIDFGQLDALPPPIAGHLRRVLPEGARRIASVDVVHRGSFNLSPTGEQWRPFTSRQRVVTTRPGFVWNARIPMLPGLSVHVHDAYVAGEGILEPAVLGLFPLTCVRDRDETARGELMRFLAEAPWYPTALMPGPNLHWEPIDGRSARATLVDGDLSVSMSFHVGDDGLIEAIRTDARARLVDGVFMPTPWEGRMSNYQRRDGLLVPLSGEVAWLTPQGRLPYWRGTIESIRFHPGATA